MGVSLNQTSYELLEHLFHGEQEAEAAGRSDTRVGCGVGEDDPAKLQQIYGSGKAVVHVVEPNKKFKLDFPSYLQQGDMISVALDKEKNLLNGLSVNTYLDKPDDKINFETNYGSLPDGTQYPASTTLDAQAKNVKIVIQNAGYKKTVN